MEGREKKAQMELLRLAEERTSESREHGRQTAAFDTLSAKSIPIPDTRHANRERASRAERERGRQGGREGEREGERKSRKKAQLEVLWLAEERSSESREHGRQTAAFDALSARLRASRASERESVCV